jgi:glycosyltransferase involved in cell wall biosynthesis
MKKLGVWFPAVKTNTGTDVFTQRLVDGLNQQGIRAEITWLPLRAEYMPWSVPIPKAPEWATVVHVNTWLHNRFLPKNLPIIATIHHSIHDPNLRPYKGSIRALYHQYWIAPNERRVMKKAQHVIAVSQFVANMAKQTLCDVPMQVIYNGVDTELFRPNKNIKNNNKTFRLLYVGAWKKLKGVDLLSLIMKELGNDFELYYTGSGTADKDRTSMPHNMYDLGHLTQHQVIHQMQKADAFLFPSRSEGFGLVVAEAMACGLPVVTSNIASLAEIINPGISGFLCKTNDISEFAETIRSLKRQEGKRSFIFDENISIKTMIDKYKKIYISQNI